MLAISERQPLADSFDGHERGTRSYEQKVKFGARSWRRLHAKPSLAARNNTYLQLMTYDVNSCRSTTSSSCRSLSSLAISSRSAICLSFSQCDAPWIGSTIYPREFSNPAKFTSCDAACSDALYRLVLEEWQKTLFLRMYKPPATPVSACSTIQIEISDWDVVGSVISTLVERLCRSTSILAISASCRLGGVGAPMVFRAPISRRRGMNDSGSRYNQASAIP